MSTASNPGASLPVARDYDDEASTGRGLGLVAAVARDHGVESLGADGKVIWFCIGDPVEDERSADDILDAWAIDEWPDDDVGVDLTTVVLSQMPPTLWLSARQHNDALLRELSLYAAEHPVPVDFVDVDRARTSISVPLARAVDDAHAAGLTRSSLPEGHPSPLPWVPDDFDLELHISRSDSAAYLALQDTLDLAERLAVSGDLLVRPGLPEIIAVRDWAASRSSPNWRGRRRSPGRVPPRSGSKRRPTALRWPRTSPRSQPFAIRTATSSPQMTPTASSPSARRSRRRSAGSGRARRPPRRHPYPATTARGTCCRFTPAPQHR